MEWHIKRLRPELRVECTDYTANAIKQLKKVFVNCDAAYTFDMLAGDWSMLNHCDVLILSRVSTEFDYDTWVKLFQLMAGAGIKNILFIPTELLGVKDAMRKIKARAMNKLRGREDTFCGWMYSENEFVKMWNRIYRVEAKIGYQNTAIYKLRKI